MHELGVRVLKSHVEAAMGALLAGPYRTKEEAATAIAQAVVEADDKVRWVVVADNGVGNPPIAYGPYASAETARKAIMSGLMIVGPRGVMLLAMQAVPRKGHTLEGKSNGRR